MEDIKTFLEMLTYRRPHGSEHERKFAEDFLLPQGVMMCGHTNNYIIDVGENPDTLFSSHIDTVHRDSGYQKIHYDTGINQVFKTDNQPLGADDAAGVWLMLEMLKEKVPGRYVFHVGEERGGIGSNALVDLRPDFLEPVKRAVAFDRRGVTNVITHQAGGRCASDAFATELSAQLNRSIGMKYAPCDSGIFTDTANFTHIIPECTNLSVGYESEHSPKETQNVRHLLLLRDALLRVNWNDLPVERDPNEIEQWDDYRFNSYSLDYGRMDTPYSRKERRRSLNAELGWNECYDLVYEKDPAVIAEILFLIGVTYSDIQQAQKEAEQMWGEQYGS